MVGGKEIRYKGEEEEEEATEGLGLRDITKGLPQWSQDTDWLIRCDLSNKPAGQRATRHRMYTVQMCRTNEILSACLANRKTWNQQLREQRSTECPRSSFAKGRG